MKQRLLILLKEFVSVRSHELSLKYLRLPEFKKNQKHIDDLIIVLKSKYPDLEIQINELIESVNFIDAIYIEESYKAGFKDCYNFIKLLEET